MSGPEELRVQVWIARATELSRRAAERCIREGRVLVNGEPAELGGKALPGRDEVRLDGQVVALPEVSGTWLLLHKPPKLVTSKSDEKGRETVMDLLDSRYRSLFPVGRLDMMTTGLLLLTDDGVLADRLLRPKSKIQKTYRLTLDRPVGTKEIRRLCQGEIVLDGRPVQAADFRQIAGNRYEMTLTEGRNRQVRRMLEAVGREVVRLHRSRFGPLKLGDLEVGAYRELTADEVARLEEATR